MTDLESKEAPAKTFTTPIGLSGCSAIPFLPEFLINPETTQQDLPDGIMTDLKLHHTPSDEIDSSQLETSTITLPEGMTMNPSAAAEVTAACTPAQARLHSATFGVACPAASKIAAAALEVPTLPAGSLTGSLYLGGPEGGGPVTGGSNPAQPEYTVYLNAESTRYGVDVRVEGRITDDPTTGRLTTTFFKLPEQPFSDAILRFTGGPFAPIANPLACGAATSTMTQVPYSGTPSLSPPIAPLTIDSNGAGGACASPLPFTPTQTAQNQAPGSAGAKTSFTLNFTRTSGQQYLSQIKTTLPPGLVALIPSTPLCEEPQAAGGTCSPASQIGLVSVTAGAGKSPFAFSGPVYLTGPYNGAPYGLSIVVPAVAGPFNLGNVVTRAAITVDPYTSRVTVTGSLPRIVQGVPLRLQRVTIAITKQNYLLNPTNCGVLATESTVSGFTPGSTAVATQNLSSPFQVNNCGALAFKPSFKAKTNAKTSKANGASLETTINIGAGQTNFKTVMVQLPKQLPSRLTTLQKACSEAVFAANPFKCPSGSFVGGARANTPVLPGKLRGPAILVSHGGAAFPDLDLVMEANGVRVILAGNTNITKGVTTTTFAMLPDVPVSSVTVNLPIGSHSAVTANGSLCINTLAMPTTLIGQNGFKVKVNTKVAVAACPVRIAGQKVIGNTAYVTVQTYSAGRISGSGSNLATVYRKLGKAEKTATLKVPLSRGGQRKGRPLKVKLRVGFVPKAKGGARSASTTTVSFR